MKTEFLLIVSVLLGSVALPLEGKAPEQKPIALTIIWDASSSTGPIWQDFRSLTKQATSKLKSGDYFECITAEQNKEIHLWVSQFIKSGTPQEIETINSFLPRKPIFYSLPFLIMGDVDVTNAVELAFRRTKKFLSTYKEFQGHVGVIVLSDGQLRDDEVEQVPRLSEEAERLGWRLYFTGTPKSSKKLVIIAAQKQIEWSLINQADLSSWVQKLRQCNLGDLGEFHCIEPLDNTTVTSEENVEFKWEASKNAYTYELVVLDTTGQEFHKSPTKDLSIVVTLPPGVYEWYVEAKTSDGFCSQQNKEGSYTLTIKEREKRRQPGEFALQKPNSATKNYTGKIPFTWECAPNASYYNLIIKKDNKDYDLVTKIQDCSKIIDLPEGYFSWTVKAFDETGTLERKAKQFLSFTVVPLPRQPETPRLELPPDGDVRPIGKVNLQWEDVAEVNQYEVEVSGPGSDTVTELVEDQNCFEMMLLKPGEYLWRVFVIIKPDGTRIASRERWLIKVIGDFGLVSPEDGNVIIVGETVTLKWTSAENTTKYVVDIGMEGQAPKTINTSDTELNITLDKPGDYWWTVFTVSDNGQKIDVKNKEKRRIIVTDITAPEPQRPTSGHTYRSGKVAFSWRGSKGAVGYLFEVFKQQNGNSVLYLKKDTNDTKITIEINEKGNYTWIVSAVGRLGEICKMSSPPIEFKLIESEVPSVVKFLILVFTVFLLIVGWAVVRWLWRPMYVELIAEGSLPSQTGDNVFRLTVSPGGSGDDNKIYLYASEQERERLNVFNLQAHDYYVERLVGRLHLISETDPDERRKISFGVFFTVKRPDGSEVTAILNEVKHKNKPETDEDQDNQKLLEV